MVLTRRRIFYFDYSREERMRLCFSCYVAGILQNFESSGTDSFSFESKGLTEFKQGSLILYTTPFLWQSDNGILLTNQFALQMTSKVALEDSWV